MKALVADFESTVYNGKDDKNPCMALLAIKTMMCQMNMS